MLTVESSNEPRRMALRGQRPLSGTTLQGRQAILLGVVVVLLSLPIVGVGVGWLEPPSSRIHAPLWVIGLCGILFSGGGGWLIIHGVRGLHRVWNMEQGKRRLPDRPWLWDYPWRAKGITDNHLQETIRSLIALGGLAVFLAPFNWLAFVSNHGGVFWQVVTGILDAIVLIGVGGYVLKSLGQYMEFGIGSVKFERFPFHLGRRMDLTVERLPIDMTRVHLDLRCIEEAYEIRQREGGDKQESVVVCYQAYHDTQTIRGELVNEKGELRCSWNLPDDQKLSSTPSERPAIFWELEVRGERHGRDYHSRFLLPVYVKPNSLKFSLFNP